MVLPIIIGGGFAILTTFVLWKASKKIDDIRHDAKDFVKTSADIATDVRHDAVNIVTRFALTIDDLAHNLTKNADEFTHGCLQSLAMISHRIDVSVHLLTNVVLAFLTTCSLSLLLHLTDFSPFLRTIVWFLFFLLCFYMVRNYIRHSNLVESSQQYVILTHSTIAKKKTMKGRALIMDTVEPLIKQQLNPKKLSYRPCAVVMGRTGAGKTTLINAVCGTKHTAGEGAGSITRNLYRNDVSCGEHTFSLIDTPGTDSSTETYKHAFLLREALTATRINTIFILIKYDSRFDKMIENYFEVEQPVYNYSKKIVVMISHWDQSKNPQKNYNEICKLFQDECPNVTNLIFYSEQNLKTEVVNLMYNCMSNMNEEKLHIKDEDFFFQFNIYEMKSRIKVSFGQYQKKANLLVQEYTELINSDKSASVEDKDEVLHMTIVKFKDEMEALLQEFQRQHGGAMVELDYYTFSIKMEKENVRICDEFVEKVVPLMSYSLSDNQDPRNLIKRCPHCKLIWFKTEGCDGLTSCGNNNFDSPKDVSNKAFWKYQLERIGGKLQIVRNPAQEYVFEEVTEDLENPAEANILETMTANPEENFRQNVETSFMRPVLRLKRNLQLLFPNPEEHRNAKNSKGLGCGKEFKWSALPKIEDELILELFKVKTIDQAKQLIQAGNFKEVRQNYESNIDSTFHS